MDKKIIIISVCLFLSLLANLVFFCSDGLFYLRQKQLANKCLEESPVLRNRQEFYSQVLPASLDWVKTGWTSQTPTINGTPKENFYFNFKGKEGFKPFTSSEEGLLIHSILEYAILHNQKKLLEEIKEIFETEIRQTEITVTDQAINGVIACQLFSVTREGKYREYADKMYRWIRTQDSEYGIVYHGLKEISNVDGVGMCVPFLCSYAKTFNVGEAYELALKQIDTYNKYGVDADTGMPAQGYKLSKPHIKMGSCNWGRGISWYICGLMYVNTKDLNADTQSKIEKFNATLVELNKQWGGNFSQFYGQGGIDLSATLPCLYYLYRNHLADYSLSKVLSFSKYMHDGIMYNSSGPIRGCNLYSEFFGPNPISQAFMIKLLNLK